MTLSGLRKTPAQAHAHPRETQLPAAPSPSADRPVCAQQIAAGRTADLEFVKELLQRDGAAWSQFLERYQRLIAAQVWRVAQTFPGSDPRTDSEDACAEVLAALFRDDFAALRSFSGRSLLSTWLTIVARRVALAYFSQRQREAQQRTAGEELVTEAAAPVSSPPPTEEVSQELLEECLAKLTPADRSVLQLYFFQGRNYQSIGNALGITTNSVGPRLSRAQKRLRLLIKAARRRPSDDSHRKGG